MVSLVVTDCKHTIVGLQALFVAALNCFSGEHVSRLAANFWLFFPVKLVYTIFLYSVQEYQKKKNHLIRHGVTSHYCHNLYECSSNARPCKTFGWSARVGEDWSVKADYQWTSSRDVSSDQGLEFPSKEPIIQKKKRTKVNPRACV